MTTKKTSFNNTVSWLATFIVLGALAPSSTAAEVHNLPARLRQVCTMAERGIIGAVTTMLPQTIDYYMSQRLLRYSRADVPSLRPYFHAVRAVETFMRQLTLEPHDRPVKPGFRLLPRNCSSIVHLGRTSVVLQLPGLAGPNGPLVAKISGFAYPSVGDESIRLQGWQAGGAHLEDSYDALRATVHHLRNMGISCIPSFQQFRLLPSHQSDSIKREYPQWFHLVDDLRSNGNVTLHEADTVLNTSLKNRSAIERDLDALVRHIKSEVRQKGLYLHVDRHVQDADPTQAIRRAFFVQQPHGSFNGNLIVGDLDHFRIVDRSKPRGF